MKTKLTQRQAWSRRQLGDYFRIKHGYAFKSRLFAKGGAYVVLTPGNFRPDGGLKFEGQQKYYAGEFPPDFLLKAGDFLIVMTDLTQNAPILGSPAFIPEDDRYLHNQRLGKVIELKEGTMERCFLYHLLNSDGVRAQIKASATGATVRHTAPDRIYAVEVEVPPLLTQRKIAAILSAYDDLIENNLRRIKILEEMAQLVYHEWFVNFRFPGHEKVRMVDSELGMIPEWWEVRTLGNFCHITMGQSPKSEFYNTDGKGLPFHQGVTHFGQRFPTDRVYCSIQNRIAERGDILFSVRAPVGRINVANKKIVIGRGLCAIRSNSNYHWFVLHQLRELFKEEDTMGGGTIFKAVTKDDMHRIKVVMPVETRIRLFEEIAQPIAAEVEVLTDKNANLRQTRDLLLPKLISGEMDVSELDIDIGEEPE